MAVTRLSAIVIIPGLLASGVICGGARVAGALAGVTVQRSDLKSRERAAIREQFSQNFREIQLLGIKLLHEHEVGRLKPDRLARNTREIGKKARTLKSLMVLGEPAEPPEELEERITTPTLFDRRIRQLTTLIQRFVRYPIHQNTKVFNTDEASRASGDLETIISLSKAIESSARDYSGAATAAER